ncbi:hypothetical protein ANN_22899 [Periplaneta americana]|uniref:Reverse transcriptase domain-containing protein n=1 Tax=Periplaneta americana TaxID=6978 RepID=A0ABQ8SLJ9_PERAM|nr:hypothetical protein ANN_22899 [Periplaneta americana]
MKIKPDKHWTTENSYGVTGVAQSAEALACRSEVALESEFDSRLGWLPRWGFFEVFLNRKANVSSVGTAVTYNDSGPGFESLWWWSGGHGITSLYKAHLGQKAWVDITARLEKPTYYELFPTDSISLNLLNVCWKYGYSPEEWQEAIIIPIFKKGDRRDCGNYRGISLLNTGYKIYSKIITNRLAVITENILLEEQHGFRKNRSCIDCVFSISQMIEKNREYNIPTYIAFIDYNKAFDTVNRQKLWEVLRSKGIPDHLIRVIQGLYSNTKIRIKLKNGISEESKEITRGVRQGCSLSPVLFNLYIDDVTRRWLLHMETIFNRTNTPLNTILFADDQAIFTTTEDDLQRALFKLNCIAKEYDLQISTKRLK